MEGMFFHDPNLKFPRIAENRLWVTGVDSLTKAASTDNGKGPHD
jgi:hypothetical protein